MSVLIPPTKFSVRRKIMLHTHNFSPITICLTVVLAWLSFASSASGQNATYSDIWFDDSQAEAGIGQVVGCGVTDGDYDDDHMYYVRV
jgi:hypothetical protein